MTKEELKKSILSNVKYVELETPSRIQRALLAGLICSIVLVMLNGKTPKDWEIWTAAIALVSFFIATIFWKLSLRSSEPSKKITLKFIDSLLEYHKGEIINIETSGFSEEDSYRKQEEERHRGEIQMLEEIKSEVLG